MTLALADGPGSLEVVHVWTPGGGLGAALEMNRLRDTSDDLLLPRIVFDTMPGFRALPESDDNRAPKTGRLGEHTYRSLVRGKTYTVRGRMQGLTLAAVRTLEASMRRALAERNLEGTWAAIPLTWDGTQTVDDTAYWESRSRVLQFDPDEGIVTKSEDARGYELGFLAGWRMSDPRWYWTASVSSATDATDVTVTNLGDAPAEPVITVVNPGAALTVQNDTTGKKLVFAFDAPLVGNLVIDFAARTAYLNGGTVVDYVSYMTTATSTWWDADAQGLTPGANVISQVGASSVQVTFQHATY